MSAEKSWGEKKGEGKRGGGGTGARQCTVVPGDSALKRSGPTGSGCRGRVEATSTGRRGHGTASALECRPSAAPQS